MSKGLLKCFTVFILVIVVFSACTKEDSSLADIATLKSQVSSLKKTTDSLKDALATTNFNLNQTNANVSSLQRSIDSVRSQLVGISTRIDNLVVQLTSVNANIASITSQLALLNQEYADLLAKLNLLTTQLIITPASLTSGLVAYYPFTGNANDSSGNGNNGTTYNVSLTTDRKGNSNSAYLFAGNPNSYIDCGNSSSLRSIKDTLSISLWIKINGAGYAAPRIIDFGNGAAGYSEFALNIEPISGTIYKFIAGYRNVVANTSTISQDNWYHIVFINDKNSSSLYINGVLINTNYGNLSAYVFPTSGGNLNIGRMNHPANDAFAGSIDDIRIYNRVLTSTEIGYLYRN